MCSLPPALRAASPCWVNAVKSATGLVVEEDGRAWLSEFGSRRTSLQAGEAIAVVGPLKLPAAKSYAAVLSYAVMRPEDSWRTAKMIRRNGSTTVGDSALQGNSDVPDLWCINPWLTSHMIGAAHSQRTDAAEQERGRAMFAALSGRSVATAQEEPS